jgi:hypothetical protein
MKTVLIVLILSFGPHVLISYNNGNLEIHQRHMVLIEQGFSKIDYQQSYGIIPRSVDSLFAIQQEKKEAPIFAGANETTQDGSNDQFAARQKKKLTGVDTWRTVV